MKLLVQRLNLKSWWELRDNMICSAVNLAENGGPCIVVAAAI